MTDILSKVPVHKLFKRLDDPYASIDDALKAVGADFEVEKVEIQSTDGESTFPMEAGVRRKDNKVGLKVMGSRYGVVQYRVALDFLSDIVGNREAEIYAGRVIDNGAKLHLIVKTPDFIELSPGERFDCYFTVSASHDGTGCLQALCSPVHNISQTVYTPVVQVREGRSVPGIVRIKHSAKVEARLGTAKAMFAKLHRHFEEFGEQIQDLAGISLREQEARDYFLSIIPDSGGKNNTRADNIRNKMFDIYKTVGLCRNLPSCKDTLFGAFMAVLQYSDYYKTVRKSIRRSEIDARIEARLTGDAAKLKAEGFAFALKLAREFA